VDDGTSSFPHYWLDIFTVQTWNEFRTAGSQVSGFRLGLRRLIRRVQLGDVLICYVIGVSRFVGLLEVVSGPYEDASRIWAQEPFPLRLRVRPMAEVAVEAGVPIKELLSQFSWYAAMTSPKSWHGQIQNSLREWRQPDGQMVAAAIRRAVAASEDSKAMGVSEPGHNETP
jgi:predicted RNA-binding protein